ncbi:MAG TPA: hypothetical protein VM513_18065 [Kofleriaceae bacterium]|nr:hypothetical protein [Kofleriaceae bacterium]
MLLDLARALLLQREQRASSALRRQGERRMNMKAIVMGLLACTSLAYATTESKSEQTTITGAPVAGEVPVTRDGVSYELDESEPDDGAPAGEVPRPADGQVEPARKFIGCWKDEDGGSATCCDLEDDGSISCTTGPIIRG